jgi:hypothetical protein
VRTWHVRPQLIPLRAHEVSAHFPRPRLRRVGGSYELLTPANATAATGTRAQRIGFTGTLLSTTTAGRWMSLQRGLNRV